jgi:hypothetical protein
MALDLTNLPSGPFERRARVLLESLPERVKWAVRYMESEYPSRDLLLKCREFVSHHMVEGGPSYIEALNRIGFFPWVEAEHALDQAVIHALIGSYRAAFDDVRRGLELVAVGCFFLSPRASVHDARAWLSSERETPFFTRSLDQLGNLPRFLRLDDETGWIERLKTFYWHLCDVVHVRGSEFSFQKIEPVSGHIGGAFVWRPDGAALRCVLDAFTDGTRQIALLLAVTNPILLVGLPMSEKFGFSGPMGGFYEEDQAALLRELLPDHARDGLVSLAEADPEVISVRDDIMDRPDVTEEELHRQAQVWDRIIKRGT